MRHPSVGSLPSIQQPQQGQHQPMGLPGTQPSLPSHGTVGRPSIDRAHTFPTPPSNTPAVLGSMGGSDSFNWQGQGMNGPQGTNPMHIDASLSNARSMPNTPATTPPGHSMQNMQSYPPVSQGYEASRQMYHAPPSQPSPYQTGANAHQDRMYGQHSYAKNDMGPPIGRTAPSSGDHQDTKPVNGVLSSGHPSHQHPGDEEQDHDHDAEYTHDSGAYDAGRTSYNYTAPGVNALANESHLSPDMTGSPNHPTASGRATPRTAAPPQPYYSHHAGYNTPPRVQQSSSNLYHAMTNDRAPTNGVAGNDVYAPPGDLPGSMPNGYAPQPPMLNGSAGGLKRGRDDDDLGRAEGDGSGNMGAMDLKRRKTFMESTTIPTASYDAMSRPASAIAAPNRR
jgi:protein SOK2